MLRLSEACTVRGAIGPQLMGIVVTDQEGRRRTMPLYNQPRGMIAHIAARLLASDADIDPECRFKPAGRAGIGATDRIASGGDPYVRLSARGRVRVCRGADMQIFFAVFLIALGTGLIGLAMNGVTPRWPG